jgi:hypothetical protein
METVAFGSATLGDAEVAAGEAAVNECCARRGVRYVDRSAMAVAAASEEGFSELCT